MPAAKYTFPSPPRSDEGRDAKRHAESPFPEVAACVNGFPFTSDADVSGLSITQCQG
jgi:hypothetical protein